jgi:hypothetical protein
MAKPGGHSEIWAKAPAKAPAPQRSNQEIVEQFHITHPTKQIYQPTRFAYC